jgi:hypothetical protein
MRPPLRIGLFLLALAGAALLASRADLGSNLVALLPSGGDQLGREVRFFAAQGSAQILALEAWRRDPADGADPAAVLLHAAGGLEACGAKPMLAAGPGALAALDRAIYDHLPVLVPPERLEELRARTSGDGLRAWLAQARERAARPEDQLTANAFYHDPLAIAGVVLDPLKRQLAASDGGGGVVVHPDGQHCLLLLKIAFPPEDPQRGPALMAAVDAAAAAAEGEGVHIEAVGSYRHFRDNYAGLLHDLLWTLPTSMLLIAAVLWSLVRSGRVLLAAHLPAAVSVVAGVAALAGLGKPVPLVLIGFASAFLGIAVENAIHMALALQRGAGHEVRRPLITSYLTTAVAFAVLCLSGVPALRSLGILVVAGLLAGLGTSLWLLPLLVPRRHGSMPWAGPVRWLVRLSMAPARWRVVATVVISALTLPGLLRLELVSDLKRLDGSRPETWVALDAFLDRWGGLDASEFLVAERPDRDAALAAAAAARRTLGFPPSSVELLLPDRAEQERRRLAWNAFWSAEHDRFSHDLRAAVNDRAWAALAPALELYREREAVPEIGPGTWTGTPVEELLASLVQRHDAAWQVATPLVDLNDSRRPDPEAADRLGARLPAGSGAWVASRSRLARDLVAVIRSDLARLGVWMAVAMGALVWLMERRLRAVLAILLPPILALGWAFGLLGWCGVPLTAFSVLAAAFVAGIGLDNAVFLAAPGDRAHHLPPVLGCTLTAMLGVGSLVGSSNPVLNTTGLSLVVGLVACLLAFLLLTPLLLGDSHGAAVDDPTPPPPP